MWFDEINIDSEIFLTCLKNCKKIMELKNLFKETSCRQILTRTRTLEISHAFEKNLK